MRYSASNVQKVRKSSSSTPGRNSIDETTQPSNSQRSKIISKYTQRRITEVDEKEEHLLFVETNEDPTLIKSEFKVEEYDETCPEFLKIESIICLKLLQSKVFVYFFLNIFTLFVISLIFRWFPELEIKLIYNICKINECTHLAVYGKNRSVSIIKLDNVYLPTLSLSHLKKYYYRNAAKENAKMFEYKLYKYILNEEKGKFTGLKCMLNSNFKNIHQFFINGLSIKEVNYQGKLYGECDIDIKIDSIVGLIVKEISDPFYIFQICSVILWFFHDYVNYAIVIVISTIVSLFISVVETRENLLNIQAMSKYSCDINVHRSVNCAKRVYEVNSRELVPGDIFELPEAEFQIPCDCLLIQGTVVVNESMLTGESVPIIKQSIGHGNEVYTKFDKKYMLFAGTKVVQKRNNPLCLVLKTGFNTEKGNLIRSILFPKEQAIEFKKDSVTYIKIMAILSFIGFFISLPFMMGQNIPIDHMILRSLDLITTTVPPALPACIGIGISYALHRIKAKGMICINRERINMAGKVDVVCFDKTGTLTEDSLNIFGFKPSCFHQGTINLDCFLPDIRSLQQDCFILYKQKRTTKTQEMKISYIELMACCHSITKIGDKLLGDPIDVQMFESTGWTLIEDHNESVLHTSVRPPQEVGLIEKLNDHNADEEFILHSHYEIGIVRRFEFTSSLQRMSVLVKNNSEEHFKAYCKGAPEKIRDLCKTDTVPKNFERELEKYTNKGFRVLAFGMKKMKMSYMQSQQVSREIIESNMIFLGFLIVENKLKDETKDSIIQLRQGGLRMMMATGDNILTAISIAGECRILDKTIPLYECEVIQNNVFTKVNWNIKSNVKMDETMITTRELQFDTGIASSFASLPVEDDSFRISDPLNGDLSEISQSRIFSVNKSSLFFAGDKVVDLDSYEQFERMKRTNIAISILGNSFENIKKLKDRYMEKKDKAFHMYYEIFNYILDNGYIFARMSPDHKTLLVEALQERGKVVCMCGDGANDCGALKAADVGVSVSIEEASIAAPFTSKVNNISCLMDLFIEGKASLVTSTQCFKYMMLYSIIQFCSVTMLNILNTYLTDTQFLTADLFLIFPLAYLIAR
jgi:cation-transporting ATPase 13A2